MKAKKYWKMFKAFAENFPVGMGVSTVVFSIIGVIVTIPLVVTMPISVVAGLIVGAVGLYFAMREMKKKEKAKENTNNEQQNSELKEHENKEILLSIKRELEHEIHEMRDIQKDMIKNPHPSLQEAQSSMVHLNEVSESAHTKHAKHKANKKFLSKNSSVLFQDNSKDVKSNDNKSTHENDVIFQNVNPLDHSFKPT